MTRKRTKRSSKADKLTTVNALATALDVTRQTLHEWRKAEWWPVTTDPPWRAEDVTEIVAARIASSSRSTGSDELSDQLKRAMVLKNIALATRYQRQSETELGNLFPTSKFIEFVEGIIDGGSNTVACQQAWQRCTDSLREWLSERGTPLKGGETTKLDQLFREAIGNPIAEAVKHALDWLLKDWQTDNPLLPLIERTIELNTRLGRRGPLEEARDEQ